MIIIITIHRKWHQVIRGSRHSSEHIERPALTQQYWVNLNHSEKKTHNSELDRNGNGDAGGRQLAGLWAAGWAGGDGDLGMQEQPHAEGPEQFDKTY